MPDSDCLVLLIEDSIIYMNLFILFDVEKNMFFICGKKIVDPEVVDWTPFSFYCKKEREVMRFIDVVMDKTVNTRLYNFNELPLSCSEISFDLLDSMKHVSCEIVKYMEDDSYAQNVNDYLEILKNVKNEPEDIISSN